MFAVSGAELVEQFKMAKNCKKGYRRLLKKPLKGYRYRQKKFIPPVSKGPPCAFKDGFAGFDVPPTSHDEVHKPALRHLSIPIKSWSTLPLQTTTLQFATQLKPIRVLSMFDGIGTGLYVLKKLNIAVDVYFSCEVDAKALSVAQRNFHGQMVMLGCVKSLTSQVLECLGQVDLLIGGSPCSDLSLVNWRRRGLDGRNRCDTPPKLVRWFGSHHFFSLCAGDNSSGTLFYEYSRVLQWLQSTAGANKTPFFFLFENTFAMEVKNRQEISSVLGCEPLMRCSSNYVPMIRKRLFWSNIPQHNSFRTSDLQGRDLQQYLHPQRRAAVKTVPTITSSSASQRGQGGTLPVVAADNTPQKLYITEQECLFGFPEHFTDCADLSITDRRRLLGKSWCVPVVEELLAPLQNLFATTCCSSSST